MTPPSQLPFLELLALAIRRLVVLLRVLAVMARRGFVPTGFVEVLMTHFADGAPAMLHGAMEELPSGMSCWLSFVVVVPLRWSLQIF